MQRPRSARSTPLTASARRTLFAAAAMFLALVLSPQSATAQCPSGWLPNESLGGINGTVYTLTLWDPDGPGPMQPALVAGGAFTMAGDTPANNIALWDGATWSALGEGTSDYVFTLAVLPDNSIVAGGGFTSAGGAPANYIARWDGADWSPLGSGTSDRVFILAVLPNGELAAGGAFQRAGGLTTNYIARWNGTAWSGYGTGMNSPLVDSMKVLPNGDLLAGGAFSTAGGVAANRVARWNGTAWSAIGPGAASGVWNGGVRGIEPLDNGNLAIGGVFSLVGGVSMPYVAQWNGTSWSILGAPGMNSYVMKFLKLPGRGLIACGNFTTAGGNQARRIALWDGSSWSPLGEGVNAYAHALVLMPDGDLIVGGEFTEAGVAPALRIARYRFPVCAADFNCSGTPDVPDIFAFLSAWFAQSLAADFDANSLIEVPDIFAFLSAWFAGCS